MTPVHAPAKTCVGVWPRVSLSGLTSDTGCSGGSSEMIWFSTLACFPACCLTPLASYITFIFFFAALEGKGFGVRHAEGEGKRGVCVCGGGGGNEHHSQWRRRRSTRRTPRSWCRWQSRPPCTARRPVGEDGKSRKGQHKRERGFGRSGGGGGGGSPLTKAECDEGIPPEPTRRVRSHFLSRYLWGSSARERKRVSSFERRERERERVSFGPWPPPRRATFSRRSSRIRCARGNQTTHTMS